MSRPPDCPADSFPCQALSDWYHQYKRDLPWRKNPSPYKVWVSEMMLQQTQVKSALPYYRRFIKAFPSLKSLAKTSEAGVLKMWSGLGYYSRAKNMHQAARIIVSNNHGRFPSTKEALLRLPGIGPYTAGAILSIAYNLPLPILDGNVKRVLSRYFLETGESHLWDYSEQIVLKANGIKILPSCTNQALMELGALICLPQNPLCGRCPLESRCLAKSKNLQSSYPLHAIRKRSEELTFALFAVKKEKDSEHDADRFWVRRRPENEKWLKKLWEFPMIEIPNDEMPKDWRPFFPQLELKLKEKTGCSAKVDHFLGTLKHSITHHRLKILVFSGRARPNSKHFRWCLRRDLMKISSSSILPKALALVN